MTVYICLWKQLKTNQNHLMLLERNNLGNVIELITPRPQILPNAETEFMTLKSWAAVFMPDHNVTIAREVRYACSWKLVPLKSNCFPQKELHQQCLTDHQLFTLWICPDILCKTSLVWFCWCPKYSICSSTYLYLTAWPKDMTRIR